MTGDARIRASLPTLKRLLRARHRVMVMSHRGRPRAGGYDPDASLAPVAKLMRTQFDLPVVFKRRWIDGVAVAPGQLAVLENVRFLEGETENDAGLARRMAALCEVYVMDAFGSAHRAHASTCGVICYAPKVCAGPLLQREIRALDRVLQDPARPMLAIVGGAKVSTKIEVLEQLAGRADQLIVGGGIANTFLAAASLPIGDSLHEPTQIKLAARLIKEAAACGHEIPIPEDAVCQVPGQERSVVCASDQVGPGMRILDVGPKTRRRYDRMVRRAGTVLWNGPLGVFEDARFAQGTRALARSIAQSEAFSLAGGGDTLAAVQQFRVKSRVSYLSTGGGAFLEYVGGRRLPAVEALRRIAA